MTLVIDPLQNAVEAPECDAQIVRKILFWDGVKQVWE